MPSLNLVIARLDEIGNDKFAIWVVKAPYPGGYPLRYCIWPHHLALAWQEWQDMFVGHSGIDISSGEIPQTLPPEQPSTSQTVSHSSRLMQRLGTSLWQWVFDEPILSSLERSRGMAMGQSTPLRLRLEIRDPDMIAVPWEIMQRPGEPVFSLSQHVLFSRTTTGVEPLPYLRGDQALNILLVLGEDEKNLKLEQEASILQRILSGGVGAGSHSQETARCYVDTLLQPTPEQLISQLESRAYNVFFYAGHGMRNVDGGLLFLRSGMTLNGIELAQVLTRIGVKLAVFNSCWGAQPASTNHQAIAYSSLAEVLIRHGVPAVLAMRDEIGSEESLTFIQSLAQALRSRLPIDEAMAIARQQLLTVYRYNQPAWTLPVLYLHPEFDGELIRGDNTQMPEPGTIVPDISSQVKRAVLRSLSTDAQSWPLQPGVTRIGRMADNNITIVEPSVSKHHADILCRNTFIGTNPVKTYHLRDDSSFGTWIYDSVKWRHILHEEVPLHSGMQLKFGNPKGNTWQFIIEDS
jgi:hypothetical protein